MLTYDPFLDDHGLCTELSTYVTASFYAYQRGWVAANFFATLGVDRLNRWHDLLGGLCGYSTCPQNQCHSITNGVSAALLLSDTITKLIHRRLDSGDNTTELSPRSKPELTLRSYVPLRLALPPTMAVY